MLEKLDDVVLSNEDIDLDDIDLDIVTFFSYSVGLCNTDLNNINLDDDNFYEDDPEIIIHVRLTAWHKACKKKIDKELMPIAWHPTRAWDWFMTKDEKLWNDKSSVYDINHIATF